MLYRKIESLFFSGIRGLIEKCSKEIPDIFITQKILVFAPHPDDETFGCGGTINRLSSSGRQVKIVFVTDGSDCKGLLAFQPNERKRVRKAEAVKAAGVYSLPFCDLDFLEYNDGMCVDNLSALYVDFKRIINEYKPDIIFSPFLLDNHVDHYAVATVIQKLWMSKEIDVPVYEYPIWFWTFKVWWYSFKHPKRFLQILCSCYHFDIYFSRFYKQKAIEVYQSQLPSLGENFLRHFKGNREIFFRRIK